MTLTVETPVAEQTDSELVYQTPADVSSLDPKKEDGPLAPIAIIKEDLGRIGYFGSVQAGHDTDSTTKSLHISPSQIREFYMPISSSGLIEHAKKFMDFADPESYDGWSPTLYKDGPTIVSIEDINEEDRQTIAREMLDSVIEQTDMDSSEDAVLQYAEAQYLRAILTRNNFSRYDGGAFCYKNDRDKTQAEKQEAGYDKARIDSAIARLKLIQSSVKDLHLERLEQIDAEFLTLAGHGDEATNEARAKKLNEDVDRIVSELTDTADTLGHRVPLSFAQLCNLLPNDIVPEVFARKHSNIIRVLTPHDTSDNTVTSPRDNDAIAA